MRKIWIKKPCEPKGYSFWESELSDDENCLREEDFKNAICFVPEARFKELEEKLAEAEKASMQNGCDRNKAEFKLAVAVKWIEAHVDDENYGPYGWPTDILEKLKG